MKMNDLAGALVQTQRPLNIHLISGIGEGATPRAAFDAALTDAGVADCNRLRASSLIPPNAKIVCARPPATPHADGLRQTVVMSQMQQGRPGRYAHAGIAWVQRHDDGRGLFIDLHDDDRGRLEHDLHAAFAAIPFLRDASRGPVQTAFASLLCTGLPVCALVVAAFSGEACDLRGDS